MNPNIITGIDYLVDSVTHNKYVQKAAPYIAGALILGASYVTGKTLYEIRNPSFDMGHFFNAPEKASTYTATTKDF